jgi:phosphoglycerate dehydrogenase-like enzyme
VKIAILDDYQNVALELADWSSLPGDPQITVFNDHVADLGALVARLQPFDVLCVMRERTPLTADVIGRLPNLKFIASTGPGNASIDMQAATHRGIPVVDTRYDSAPTIEFAWCLILGLARNLCRENASLRSGGWQVTVGSELHGKTLGVLGLGHVGGPVAAIGKAFGMRVLAWTPNLTAERAAAQGVELATKAELFRSADIVTIHVSLSAHSRGLVGAAELGLMKRTAFLVNTSRGPIVDEGALIDALNRRAIAGAAIDVFDTEPLPAGHPFRTLPNVLATPHVGFVAKAQYEAFFQDCVAHIRSWMLDNA